MKWYRKIAVPKLINLRASVLLVILSLVLVNPVKANTVYLPLIFKAPEVKILDNLSVYVDYYNYLHVVGEAQNTSSVNLQFIEIHIYFYGSAGNFLAHDYTYTYLNNLPAYQKTCFEIMLPVPSGWSYYRFSPVLYMTDGLPLPPLTQNNISGSYISSSGSYFITGSIKNPTSATYDWVMPVGTLYNSAGTVVGCDYTYTDPSTLSPNQSGTFEMIFSGRNYADVISPPRIQVDADKR
jgi:hypothetical protein